MDSGKIVLSYQKGKFYEKVSTELYDGWQEVPHLEMDMAPALIWKGTKLPFVLWEQIVCFMRWSQKTHGAEALLHLFYNIDSHEWAADVFPQEPMGMSVKSLENDPDYAIVRAKYGRGWIQFGSVHHHCGMTAFQSGTDHADERDRDGLHITLGKMYDAKLDIHCRVTMGGMMYDTVISNWVSRPPWMHQIPSAYETAFDRATTYLLCKDIPFPTEWEGRVKKRVYQSYQTPNGRHGATSSDWYSKNGWVYNSTTGFYEAPAGWSEKKRNDASGSAKGTKESKASSAAETGAGGTESGANSGPGADAEARRNQEEEIWTGRPGKILSDFDLAALRIMSAIFLELGIDMCAAYTLMTTHPTQCTNEELAMRIEMFRQMRDKSVNYMYAETLLEKIGADKLRK